MSCFTSRREPSGSPCCPVTARKWSWPCSGPGDFFGEECLAGQPFRIATASALTEGALLAVEKEQMLRLLHRSASLTDWFLSQTFARLTRIEDDLADLRSNPGEKRLARTLLLLARYGKKDEDQRILPRLSQTMLAEMVGTTRSRVNFFMNKFKRQGLIDYDDGSLIINRGLRRVVDEDVCVCSAPRAAAVHRETVRMSAATGKSGRALAGKPDYSARSASS